MPATMFGGRVRTSTLMLSGVFLVVLVLYLLLPQPESVAQRGRVSVVPATRSAETARPTPTRSAGPTRSPSPSASRSADTTGTPSPGPSRSPSVTRSPSPSDAASLSAPAAPPEPTTSP